MKPARAIEMLPFIGVCAALLLAAIPLLDHVVSWVTGLLFVAVVTRLFLNRSGRRLPSLPLKLLICALGIGGIAATFGTLIGPEPGLSILILLISMKVLETGNPRDFQVLCLVGFFLGLCALFFAQSLLLWIYVAGLVALLTISLILFHGGERRAAVPRAIRLGFTLLLQALPITAVLFFFSPRISGGYRFQFSRAILGNQGISDRLEPGSVAALAQSDTPVFRAEFPDGTIPSSEDMYWRGAVLWRCEGLTWFRGPPLSLERRSGQLAGPTIKQRISLQPHGERWIFALDRPSTELRTAPFQPGGFLQSTRPVLNTVIYTVESQPENRELRLPFDQLEAAQAFPALSPAAQALVASWTSGAASGRAIVDAALRHFRKENFRYTFEPGTYGEDALDDFLFRRRTGFCEHYAAAFATLMRAAGVPARIVVGYHGGEYNAIGTYVIVRQYNAHAWCEVWLPGSGWQRIDPTDAIAPERVSAGLGPLREAGAADPGAAGGGRASGAGWRGVTRQIGLAWDSINYRWDLHVQNFHEDEQRSFFTRLGLGGLRWSPILLWSGLAIAVLLIACALWLRAPVRRRGDEAAHSYARLCRRLAIAGVPREPAEGPLRFTERAALAFPEQAPALRDAGQLYAAIRYSERPPAAPNFVAAVRALRRFTRLSPPAPPASIAALPPTP